MTGVWVVLYACVSTPVVVAAVVALDAAIRRARAWWSQVTRPPRAPAAAPGVCRNDAHAWQLAADTSDGRPVRRCSVVECGAVEVEGTVVGYRSPTGR